MSWFVFATIGMLAIAVFAAQRQRQERPAAPPLSSDARRRAQGYADYLARTDARFATFAADDRLAYVCEQVGRVASARRAGGVAAAAALIVIGFTVMLGFACYAAGLSDTLFVALALTAAAAGAVAWFAASTRRWRRAESEADAANLDVDRLLRIAGLPPRHAAPKAKTIATR